MTSSAPLLSAADLRLLEGMRLVPRRALSARTRGERLSRQKGVSIEFADFRDYADGDDLRHLDWAILARLGRPVVRTYRDETELPVYIALDQSASMDFGDKFAHAQTLAAAAGFVGLSGHDRVQPLTVGGRDPRPGRAGRGRGAVRPLLEWLASRMPDGTRGLAASLTRLPALPPGLFCLFSDGLDPQAADALRTVAARGHEIVFVQVLSPIEIDPDMEGDLRLLDAETGEVVEITAHADTLRLYRRNLDAHCDALQEATRRAGGRFLRSVTGEMLPDFTAALRRVGLVE